MLLDGRESVVSNTRMGLQKRDITTQFVSFISRQGDSPFAVALNDMMRPYSNSARQIYLR